MKHLIWFDDLHVILQVLGSPKLFDFVLREFVNPTFSSIEVFIFVETCKFAIILLGWFLDFAHLVYIKALVHTVPKWYATTPDQFCEVNYC